MSDPETIGRYNCPNCGCWFTEPNEATPETAAQIARLTAEVEELRERVDGAEASAMNCGDCYDKDAKIDRLQAVVDAAREALHLDASLLDRMIAIRRALDGEP